MNNQILRAYSIKEVSKKINVPTGTIRQWEKDLDGLLVIPRTQQGARYYTDKEITLLNKIKELREQNISKGMIRSLLEKYIHLHSEATSESFEIAAQPSLELAQEPSRDIQSSNAEEFQASIDMFKQELLNEIKSEIVLARRDIVDDVKNELLNTSLNTVKEISKSIQRSNDKRKAEVLEISDMISKASKQTSQTFTALSEGIVNVSKASYEKLLDKIQDSSRTSEKTNKIVIQKVSQNFKDTKDELKYMSQRFDTQHDYLLQSINDLKQSRAEIQQREEIFQSMLASYREVASAKKKKKWWQVWSE